MKLFDCTQNQHHFTDGELMASANYWQTMLNSPENKRFNDKACFWMDNVIAIVGELDVRKYRKIELQNGLFDFKHKDDDIAF